MNLSRFTAKWFYRFLFSFPLVRILDKFSPLSHLGPRGERAADRYLLCLGYSIVARSYQDKFGEIDLIAVDKRTIVFVEVKTRSSDHAGDPTEAVDDTKQQHLTKTAISFLKWNQLTDCQVRFDVIAIIWPDDQIKPVITHYIHAFEPTGKFQMF